MLVKSADDTKLGGIPNTLEDRNKIQNDLDRMEHWAESNRMKFSRDKCEVLHLGENKQTHSYKMRYVAQQYCKQEVVWNHHRLQAEYDPTM